MKPPSISGGGCWYSWQTAVCAAVLCLMHLPCGTTCLTLLKETGSKKWTLVGMLLLTGATLLCYLLPLTELTPV